MQYKNFTIQRNILYPDGQHSKYQIIGVDGWTKGTANTIKDAKAQIDKMPKWYSGK